MRDLDVLSTFQRYQETGEDESIKAAMSAALDWRCSSQYYKGQCNSLTRELALLRRKIDQLTHDLDASRFKCENCFGREL